MNELLPVYMNDMAYMNDIIYMNFLKYVYDIYENYEWVPPIIIQMVFNPKIMHVFTLLSCFKFIEHQPMLLS